MGLVILSPGEYSAAGTASAQVPRETCGGVDAQRAQGKESASEV
jgi:hypothetical protein